MTRHLVAVWNPSYARNAMDEHLRMLREWGRRYGERTAESDDVYVWWGKVKSANRQRPMPHGDAAFDFAPVLTSLAKAVEVQANAALRRAAGRMTADERRANVDGRTVDLAASTPLTLGQLAHALSEERALREALGRVLEPSRWFRESFPAVLAALAEVRNEAAHSGTVDREVAAHWRGRLVGVGCEGELVALARVRVR